MALWSFGLKAECCGCFEGPCRKLVHVQMLCTKDSFNPDFVRFRSGFLGSLLRIDARLLRLVSVASVFALRTRGFGAGGRLLSSEVPLADVIERSGKGIGAY